MSHLSEADGWRPVLVTTEFRGVFFGYVDPAIDLLNAKNVFLRRCRNCTYWEKALRGFLGLASHGPGKECKIGMPNDLHVYGVTAIAECSPESAERWEEGPWRN